MRTAEPLVMAAAPDAVLNALPHPVIVVAADGRIAHANVSAEAFFEMSLPLLRRHALGDLVPFGSPLLVLVDQSEQGTTERHQVAQRMAPQQRQRHLEKGFRRHVGVGDPSVG